MAITPSPASSSVPDPRPGPLPPGVAIPTQRTASPPPRPVPRAGRGPADRVRRGDGRSADGDAFALVAVLGGVLVTFGSVLPWLSLTAPFTPTVTRGGLDGGPAGVVTLVAGLAVFAIGVARLRWRVPPVVQLLPVALGGLIGGVAVVELATVQHEIAEVASPYVTAFVGSGLYLLILGAAASVVGGCGVTRPGRR